MGDAEIVRYLLENEGTKEGLQTCAILNVLAQAMISHGWFTSKEFDKAVEQCLPRMAQDSVNRMTKETRELLEQQIKISKDPLFGNLFK